MSDDMAAYRDVFLSESAEYTQSIIDGLLALEADPNDPEPVEVVFRGAHSLKGMAAAMGYGRTAELTHKMESLMDTVRKHERPADRELVDLMLRAVDMVGVVIADESDGANEVEITEIVAELMACATGERQAAPHAPEAEDEAGPQDSSAEERPADETTGTPRVDANAKRFTVRVTLEDTCVLKAVRAYMVIKRLAFIGTVVETKPSAQEIEDELFDRTFEVVVSTSESSEEVERAAAVVSEVRSVSVVAAREEKAALEGAPSAAQSDDVRRRAIPKLSETQTVRVSIGHLDQMVNLVGELVIMRSRLERLAKELESRELRETVEEMKRVSTDLQHEVMQTRMVPVGNIFNRFPRMVRDLARDLGKDITFEMEGLDIELDRTVLDEIGDPIVHLLRNSIDHGIESAEERAAAGKPEKGTVRLVALRERDHLRIVVSDDGRGMSIDRLWEKACRLGVADSAMRDTYTDKDILLMTCLPGFSTAEKATSVSGRGVGMDVVKGKIEYLGGHLNLGSELGVGTTFELVLPLTLAIIQALLIARGPEIYALPLVSVNEVMDPEEALVDTVDGSPVIVLRDGQVIGLHHFDILMGFADDARKAPQPSEHIVLIDVSGHTRALVVERLVGRQEVVIKPLSKIFRNAKGLAGATVLGDGRVALIIDPRTLFPAREEAQ